MTTNCESKSASIQKHTETRRSKSHTHTHKHIRSTLWMWFFLWTMPHEYRISFPSDMHNSGHQRGKTTLQTNRIMIILLILCDKYIRMPWLWLRSQRYILSIRRREFSLSWSEQNWLSARKLIKMLAKRRHPRRPRHRIVKLLLTTKRHQSIICRV